MSIRIGNFVIRGADGTSRFAQSLVLGTDLRVVDTPDGPPELAGPLAEVELSPSGGDDAPAIQAALTRFPRVRLAPGTFRLDAQVVVTGGRILRGSGAGNTELVSTVNAILLQADAALESLTVSRTGGNTGIGVSGSGGSLRLSDVVVRGFGLHAIRLLAAEHVVMERVAVRNTSAAGGVYVFGTVAGTPRTMLEMRGVVVSGCNGRGVWLRGVVQGALDDVAVDGCGASGIIVFACTNLRISGTRAASCTTGFDVQQSSGVRLSGCVADACDTSLALDAVTQLVAGGFRSQAAKAIPVTVGGASSGVVLNGVASDQTGIATFVDVPHVSVLGGSVQVLVEALRVVNSPLGTPTFEADVSQAGGRVAFIQHNLDAARVNSGGNYASL